VGWVDVAKVVSALRKEDERTTELRLSKSGVQIGGKYQPSECKSSHKVAIVVPYRKRIEQLKIFLSYMHPFLKRQQLEYTIFVVEQSGEFNFKNYKNGRNSVFGICRLFLRAFHSSGSFTSYFTFCSCLCSFFSKFQKTIVL
jgi:hypothetical protein